MKSYWSLYLCFVLVSAIQVSCNNDDDEEGETVSRQQEQKVIPEWVKESIGESGTGGSGAGGSGTVPRDDGQATTKRPQIGEIIGQGLQGILQGIVRAPSDIANRVQDLLDGILRRPVTAAPASPAADKRV